MQEQKPSRTHISSSYFRKLTTVTLVAVYLLILAGGVVRSTGSGMGCPDWPKCFGKIVPPTSAAELPDGYQEFYSEYRYQKNVRFARYLDLFGYGEIGAKILADERIREEAPFNVYKTWTEYINRVIGVLVGFFIVLLLLGSVRYFKSNRKLFWLSLLCFVSVIFQGWLGSIVVSTNLLQWLITVHMVIAVIIVGILTALFYFSHQERFQRFTFKRNKTVIALLMVNILFLTIQIIFGTQVRESLDIVAEELGNSSRGDWIDSLGLIFIVHRSFSLALLAVALILFYYLHKVNLKEIKLLAYTKVLVVLFVLEILSGAIMAYFAIPFWVQPIHLLLGTLLFGWQFYMLLIFSFINKQKHVYAIS